MRRVVVFGQSGSGKTMVGRAIAQALGVPHIELDALFHKPDWEPSTPDEFRDRVSAALDAQPDGWVVDGNYRFVRDMTLPQADTVVWLRLPFRVVYTRLVKRTLRRMWTREVLWNTNRESFRLSFMSRDSILLWGISHWRAHQRNISAALREIPHSAPVVELRSARQVGEFLANLPHHSRPLQPSPPALRRGVTLPRKGRGEGDHPALGARDRAAE